MGRKKTLPDGMYQRGKTYWMRFTTPAGKQVRASLQTTDLELAKKRLRKEMARHFHGDVGLVRDRPTVEDFRKAYEQHVRYEKHSPNKGWESDMKRLDRFFRFVGKPRLDLIHRSDVDRFIAYRREEVTDSTVRREMSVVKAAFNYAANLAQPAWIDKSPVRGKLPRVEKKKIDYLRPAEWEALLKAAEGPAIGGQGARVRRRMPLYEMVAVGLFAGLRLGELRHLEWEDLEVQVVHVKQDDGTVVPTPRATLHVRIKDGHGTKDDEERSVSIPQRLHEILMAYREQQGHPKTGYMFATSNGTVYMERNCLRSIKGLAKPSGIDKERLAENPGLLRSGIDKERLTWNLLRHTFASQLVMRGVSIFKVSKLLGHASVTTTEKNYADLAPSRLHDEVNAAFAGTERIVKIRGAVG